MELGENDFDQLDVQMVQQEDLEKSLNAKLNRTLAENEEELERKRLEKAEKRLRLLRDKALKLQKRSESPYAKISEKEYLRKQLKELKEGELAEAEREVDDIKNRMSVAKEQVEQLNRESSGEIDFNGRLPGESERDYLVRTGKITAFGSSSGFAWDEGNEAQREDGKKENVNIEPQASVGTSLNPVSEDEDVVELEKDEESETSDYQLSDNELSNMEDLEVEEGFKEEVEELTTKRSKNSNDVEEAEDLHNLDDGDDKLYQTRLQKWLSQRLDERESHGIPNDNNTPEWFLPHPLHKDAVLNDKFRVPGEIFKNLFDYQKTCVQWLWELHALHVGGIIGDEMGLGKTVQVISYLAGLQHSGLSKRPILIVCPSTVMRQWVNEFHNWWAPFRVSILHAIGSGMGNKGRTIEDELYELVEDEDDDRQLQKSINSHKSQSSAEELVKKAFSSDDPGRQVIVTTYAGLSIYGEVLLKKRWGYAILDEGHKIRNPNANVSIAAKQIKTRDRIILSGTPIQNNLTELWSLFDFVYPGKLGTLPVFQQEFVVPINMGGYANASNVQVQTSYRCALALKNLIGPYLLRRLKVDVARDLPKKTEMVLFCKLTASQKKQYLDFLKSADAEKVLSGKRHALYGIDILKKICNHPDLVLATKDGPQKAGFGDAERSGKMQVLKSLIKLWQSQGHKILLFTQTRQMLNILEKFVKSLETTNYLRMDGTTPIKVRQELMDTFNNSREIHLFLLTTRVGGLGVNLVGADRVIIFDPDWNPSTDLQARERAWRLGQKRDVTIYRLMTRGTIEEKIYQRQIFKQYLSNKVLKDPNQKRVFKLSELNDLFTFGNDDDEEYYRNPKADTRVVKRRKPEGDDFADIAGVDRLEKFNTGDKDDEKESDESRLLGGILEGNGISIQKDKMDGTFSGGDSRASMVQKQAEKVANEAVQNLLKSRKLARLNKIGTPTWTGSRGVAGKVTKSQPRKIGKGGFGSADVLKNLKEKKAIKENPVEAVKGTFSANIVENKEKIAEDVRQFLKNQKGYFAKSKDIIDRLNFSMENDSDVRLVRSILREIANWDKGRAGWVLREEFSVL